MPSKDHPIVSSHRDAATRIFTYLNVEHGIKLKPIVALEVLARALGVANWQTLKAMADQGRAPRSADLVLAPAATPAEVPTTTVTGRMAESGFAANLRDKLVRNLKYRCEAGKFDNGGDFGQALDRVQEEMQVLLSRTQRAAIHEAVTARVSIISGYPDSAKAVIAEAIVRTAALLDVRNPINARRGEPGALAGSSFKAPEYRTVDVAGLFKQSSRMRLRQMLDDCELFIIDQHVTADPVLFWDVVQATPSDCHLVILGEIKRRDGSEIGAMLDELIENGQLNFVQLHEALGRQQARIDKQMADAARTVTPGRQQPDDRSAGVPVLDLLDDEPSPAVVKYDGTAEEVARLLLERAATAPLPTPENRDQRMAQVQAELELDYAELSRTDVHELLAKPVSLLVQNGLSTNQRLRILIRTLTLEGMRLFTNMNMDAKEFGRKLRRLNYAEPSLGEMDVMLLTAGALENCDALAPLLRVLSPKCRVILVVNPEFTAGSPEAQQIIDALKGSANVHYLSPGKTYSLEDPVEHHINQAVQVGIPYSVSPQAEGRGESLRPGLAPAAKGSSGSPKG